MNIPIVMVDGKPAILADGPSPSQAMLLAAIQGRGYSVHFIQDKLVVTGKVGIHKECLIVPEYNLDKVEADLKALGLEPFAQ